MYNGFNDDGERMVCFSNSGDPIQVEYELQTDEFGREDLVEVDRFSLYDRIQSHSDSVDIHVILARYKNGEIDLLNQRAASYFDATELPKNLAEMYRTVENGRYMFEQLPSDVKNAFNNSYKEFIAQIGTDEFVKKLDPASYVKEDKKVEVEDGEQK